MNKSDVIQDVAGVSGVSRSDVEKVIDAFFDTVRTAASSGDRVEWPSFGSFSVTQRQARTGRNPRTGEPVPIAASKALKFSASSSLKSALNPQPAKAAKKGTKAAPKKAAAALLLLIAGGCSSMKAKPSSNVQPPAPGVPATAAEVTGIYRSIHQGVLQLRADGDYILVVPEGPGPTSGSFTLSAGRMSV